MIINQIFLSIFFLYFVLVSNYSSTLLSCDLQRYINNSIWVKHFMSFISIYIFTFILDWYNTESLVVEKFKSNYIDNIIYNKNYLIKSLYYTIIIYLIFILSTKSMGKYLFIFLFISILIVINIILIKSIDPEIYDDINKKFKIFYTKSNNNSKTANKIILYQNINHGLAFFSIIILIIGNYKYYLKKYKQHKKWSWIKFWFGINKICN
jgi:hypothetical protein